MKEYIWQQNKDYVWGATCWSSNSLFIYIGKSKQNLFLSEKAYMGVPCRASMFRFRFYHIDRLNAVAIQIWINSITYFHWKILGLAGIWTRGLPCTKLIGYQLCYPGLDPLIISSLDWLFFSAVLTCSYFNFAFCKNENHVKKSF